MPDLAALKSAARAAIVIPAVFALADKVIQQPQTSIIAAFGSFAMLVFVEFGGRPRDRLLAYLGLAGAGAALVTVGTLCSRSPLLATAAMAAVGFAILLSGSINGYFAAASTAAILAFVLPVTIPAANSAILDRLEGWGLATGAGILAAMLLWPPRRNADLQSEAAAALRSVAAVVEADDATLVARGHAAREAVDGLGRHFLGTQHRPTGPTRRTAALAALPDELDWLLSVIRPPVESPGPQLASQENFDAMAATAAVLRACADRLDGSDGEPDLGRLVAARDAMANALKTGLLVLPDGTPDDDLPGVVDLPFRVRAVTDSAAQVARLALLATGAPNPEPAQPARATFEATEQLTVEHVNVRSVWFQNSLRGAAGLTLAVYIAQNTGLQHSFWVVLGTLSVLRSNALGTGWSIVSALAGTAVGIVVGALLILGIGTHETVLWVLLPIAILIATYAPRAISFAAGQAAFTVVLFILFNLIQPVGWKVGLIRVEDVAIGFAISLVVGVLFWPRGASALVRADLANAYSRAADAVVATALHLIGDGDAGAAAHAERAADTAVHRLDEAFRQYLTERSATPISLESAVALVGGASRVRRASRSLASLGQVADGDVPLERCAANLDRELNAFQTWYVALGYALVNGRPLPPQHIRDDEGRRRLFACVGDATRSRDKETIRGALVLLWASHHLDDLWRLERHLAERAVTAG